ncbi:uncharacterized protein PHACADRAFT_104699, partial [Phanerochaete carnosa HHB-10118-sp]
RVSTPPVPLPRQSFFTYLLEQDIFNDNHPYSINGQTGKVHTRGQLKRESLRLAHGLRNARNVGLSAFEKGSVALVVSPATNLYPTLIFALGAAGIVCSPANPLYTEYELAHAVKVSRASHVLAHASVMPLVLSTLRSLGRSQEDIRRSVIIVSPEDEIPAEYKSRGWASLSKLDYTPVPSVPEHLDGGASDATAFIYFSSGTTGLSKGVELSHANVTANLAQMRACYQYLQSNRDVTITGLPLFHVVGGQTFVLFPFLKGVPVVALPRLVLEEYLACIERYKVSMVITLPPVLLALTTSPLVDKYDLSSLRVMTVGAAPVSPEMILACRRRFAKKGWQATIGEAYGMDRAMSVRANHVMVSHASSIGWQFPNSEIRVVDDDDKDVPIGSQGELWFRSPSVMKGYANNPKATAETITPDGWLKTGDMAVVDKDGFVSITDRKKELIKYKGFQVAPAELEDIIGSHQGVADCAVIGVYEKDQATELPKAYVVPRDAKLLKGGDPSSLIQSIHSLVAPRVAHYKYLRGGIALTAEIPRTPSGKILKRKLRELEGAQKGPIPKL